jgi:hypothetical protein
VSRKLQEKQARRLAEEQRRKEQQRAARRRNLVTIGIALLVSVVVVGLIVLERGGDEADTGVDRQQANCEDVQTSENAGRGHVEDGTDVTYQTTPPTSGEHWQTPAETAFYPPESLGDPPEERLVHNLEHGQIVIWYSPDAPGSVLDDIEGYIDAQRGQQTLGILAAPYEAVPEGYNLTVTAWTEAQSCQRFSSDVVDAFRSRFQGRGPEQVGVPTFTGN